MLTLASCFNNMIKAQMRINPDKDETKQRIHIQVQTPHLLPITVQKKSTRDTCQAGYLEFQFWRLLASWELSRKEKCVIGLDY
uniref:Uncharacterized protein n=1 Tax=Kalanchoe fedtschenkoi TaxID=63787 RepID=A0A7N0ZXE7_KALFE